MPRASVILAGPIGPSSVPSTQRFKVLLGKLPRKSNNRQSDLQAIKLTAKCQAVYRLSSSGKLT
ncbi:hypothetical protein PGT21_029910 [Puccinia graminis f. sp. tritici]|uniref:Uncharacterized protein n=1 Tax=Puccinia graminis f. sp. tritici TaxID=56615 RepID=A0A5B0PA29_PUCGR|nr:hypothetical protein PGT21_029910 [Puccinia graminis f. sp. tritici]